ncbi:MAG TPA: methionine--tRNA ligase subunit beta, partial [Bacteroidales bacterium]|nr:methionine--tRNA ligase subunit beta [Bacteroidales bacterium]
GNAGKTDLLVPGHLISRPDLLFEKIEDEEITRQIDKLLLTKKVNEEADAKTTPGKEPVTFDDFSRLDIRTATILEAEKVPKTNKLLKLKIDTGIDIRTIVSGIAEYYDPAAIVGKQISIVANLEPRMIKGIESKGMILMAEDKNGKLVMVTPVEKVSNGSMIK